MKLLDVHVLMCLYVCIYIWCVAYVPRAKSTETTDATERCSCFEALGIQPQRQRSLQVHFKTVEHGCAYIESQLGRYYQ